MSWIPKRAALRLGLLLAPAMALAASPASAQRYGGGYSQVCNDIRNDRQAAGALIGGLLGGVTGHEVAGRGVRTEGAILGTVVGAIAGSQIGKNSEDCKTELAGRNDYGYDARFRDGPQYPHEYDGRHDPYGNDDYRGGRDDDYLEGGYEYGSLTAGRDVTPHYLYGPGLAEGKRGRYYNQGRFAGRECADAVQITRLPDGSEVRRPVEACRVARYGDWKVRD